MISKKIMKEFQESIDFLEDHPAFACGGIPPLKKKYRNNMIPIKPYDMMVMTVCKNGYALEMTPPYISVYPDNPRYEELKERIGEKAISKGLTVGIEYKEYKIIPEDKNEHLEVDYEIFYGYPWKEDHVEVWLETGCRRFIKKCSHSKKPRWERWADWDLNVSAKTFEEAIIKLAKKVKDEYGDFSSEDMIPKCVKEYNEKIRDINKEKFGDGIELLMCTFNGRGGLKSLFLRDAEINEIWWQTYNLKNNQDKYSQKDTYLDVSIYLDVDKFKNKFPI